MLRVAFFAPYFGDGGVERSTLILAESFAARGHQVDLLTIKPRGPFWRQVPGTIGAVELKAGRTLTSLPMLVGYLQRARPDALVSAQNYANVVAIWARWLARVPTRLIVTEHLAVSAATIDSHRRRERLLPLLMRWSYPRADAVVAVSQGAADDLARVLGVPRQRICLIYNPTDYASIVEAAKEPVEHPWFRLGERPVVLGVGRLTHQKDFGMLLRAFANVREEVAARLVILGEGEDRPELEALAAELGIEQDVDMPGFVHNPYKYMARASVFVFSSRYEGLGYALIEALALGTPCVSTDCPSGPREILLSGAAGPLVPVGDAKALAKETISLLKDRDRAQRLVDEGRKHLYRFCPETCLQQYLELIGSSHSG